MAKVSCLTVRYDQGPFGRADQVLEAIDQGETCGIEELVFLLEANREIGGVLEAFADAPQDLPVLALLIGHRGECSNHRLNPTPVRRSPPS